MSKEGEGKEPVVVYNTNESGTGVVCLVFLFVIFFGEPDMYDAIIQFLTTK